MTQIFGIHRIDGLPTTYNESIDGPTSLTKDIYNIPLIENLPDNISQIKTQNMSSVYISSDCVGAKIFIDGIEQIGFNTPSMITDISPGHHSFRLTHPGHTDIESEMPLDPGKTYNIFLTMGKSILPPQTDSSGVVILLALGLIGLFLIKSGR